MRAAEARPCSNKIGGTELSCFAALSMTIPVMPLAGILSGGQVTMPLICTRGEVNVCIKQTLTSYLFAIEVIRFKLVFFLQILIIIVIVQITQMVIVERLRLLADFDGRLDGRKRL